MINSIKTNNFNQTMPIAGVLPSDSNIEFVGIRSTKEVLWLQHGCNHYFKDLPQTHFKLLKSAYLKDTKAVLFLSSITDSIERQVELYTYYMYGEVDGTADIMDGKLSDSENFRDNQNCPSLLWNSKNINIGKHVLTDRQVFIIDCIAQDLPDKAIADLMGITPSTLDSHKSKLYKSVGVQTKAALIVTAFNHRIIN